MLHAETEALLKRCADYVHELAEIYRFGGTNRSHLLDDLNRLDRLIQRPSEQVGIHRDFARLSQCRATTNSQTWLEDIIDAFRFLGGEARYDDLYAMIYVRANRHFPEQWKAVVRQTIELHSRDSANFRGCHVFEHIERGRWRLAKPPRP